MTKLRDAVERLFWLQLTVWVSTFIATTTGAISLPTLDAVKLFAIGFGVQAVLLVARTRLAVLPNPGEGLPGLPIDKP